MTPKQRACYDAIINLTRDGVPPSFEELMDELGLRSKSGVHRLVHGLVDRGLVTYKPNKARSLEAVGPADHYGADTLSRLSNYELAKIGMRCRSILAMRSAVRERDLAEAR